MTAHPAPTPQHDAFDVLIVGGGLAGLATALALTEHAPSLRVGLWEAKRQTGGRAGSFTDQKTQLEVDYCQHVAMGCCTNFEHLLELAHLESSFHRSSELTFTLPSQPDSQLRPSAWLPAPLQFAPSFLRLNFLNHREKFAIARVLWKLMRMRPEAAEPGAQQADSQITMAQQITMGQWLREQGASEQSLRRFWNVILASALGDDLDRVALAPARKVFVDGFLRNRRATDLLVPQAPLSQLFGQQLPDLLQQRGVDLRTGCRARRCSQVTKTAATSPDQTWLVESQHATATAHHVVLALPWFALANLLPTTPVEPPPVQHLDQFADLPTAPISGIHLWLDGPLTDRQHTVIVDRLSQWVFRPHADAEKHYYQVVISAAHDLRGRDAQEIVAEVLNDLHDVFPDGPRRKCLHFRVVTDPKAVFSVHPHTERLRPHVQTAQPGLYVAGDFVRTGWPATMEGAVISGFMAASTILDQYQLPCPLPLDTLPANWLARRLIRDA